MREREQDAAKEHRAGRRQPLGERREEKASKDDLLEQRRERECGGGAEAVARQAERGEATRPLLRDTIAQQRARLPVHMVGDM